MPIFHQPKSGDTRISLGLMQGMLRDIKRLSNLRFSKEFRVSMDQTGTYVGLATFTSDIPEEFGIKSIVGAGITVYGGQIVIGNVKYSCVYTTVNVSEATDIIGLRYSYSSRTLMIALLGSTWATDSAYITIPLWNVSYNGVSASVVSKASRIVYPANMGNPPT